MYNYNDLIDKGFTTPQINQIEILSEYCNNVDLFEYIDEYTDVDLLRKLNNALKTKKIETWDESFIWMLQAISKNKDFECMIGMPDHKCKYMYYVLLNSDYDYADDMNRVIRQENVTTDITIILDDDIKKNRNPAMYLYPELDYDQIFTAREAYYNDFLEMIDVLRKTNEYSDYETIKDAIQNNIDIASLSHKYPLADLDFIVNAKIKGFNVETYIDFEESRTCIYLIDCLMNIVDTDEEIKAFLDKYSLLQYSSCSDIDKYLDLYKQGYEILEFINHEINPFQASYLVEIFEHVDEQVKDKLLNSCYDFNQYELELMYACIENKRTDLIPIIANLKYPNKRAYSMIAEILMENRDEGTNFDVVKLFYDKGNDALKTYDSCYEFDSDQKEIITEVVFEKIVDENNLEILRDNRIRADVLDVVGAMIHEGLDIKPLIQDLPRMHREEIYPIYKCLQMGYKVEKNHDNEINKESER